MKDAPRIAVTLVVGIESESNFYAGFIENLSARGAFVATHALLSLGSTVDLCIFLPQKDPIRARGTVRWLRPHSESNDAVPGLGIRFDHLSFKDATRVRECNPRVGPHVLRRRDHRACSTDRDP
jgi:uncharacterized protein (TIGR02266 family)